ncbi:MAG: SLC13 family permease [Alphaproteobacteria bacterium]
MRRFTVGGVFTALVLAAALAMLLAPMPASVGPGQQRLAALVVVVLGLWATGVVATHLTALGFMFAAILFGLAPADVIFSGFVSAAFWLIFGGMIVGVAVQHTGLGERFARIIVGHLGQSYRTIIVGIVLVSVALAFLVPSAMARLLILMPIALSLADSLGFETDSPGRRGLALAVGFGTFMPAAAILPANVPNVILAGVADSLYDVTLTYGDYLVLHFPVLGLLKAAVIAGLIVMMFRDAPRAVPTVTVAPATAVQKRLGIVLAVALVLWVTDFLHGVSPAWVAMGAGLVCLVPGTGFLPARAFDERLQYSSLFYAAGVIGLGATIAYSGLGGLMGDGLLAVVGLEAGAPRWNFWALSAVATLLGTGSTMPGVPAILGPLAGGLAATTGLPLVDVLMTQVVGFSTIFLPYQVGPLMIALHLGGVPLRHGIRLCLAVAAVTIVVLWPLNFAWWLVLGKLS